MKLLLLLLLAALLAALCLLLRLLLLILLLLRLRALLPPCLPILLLRRRVPVCAAAAGRVVSNGHPSASMECPTIHSSPTLRNSHTGCRIPSLLRVSVQSNPSTPIHLHLIQQAHPCCHTP